ncbi:MAG: MFS transporter [Cytophagales bacterium]
MELNNKKIIRAWCMYDWANSVYSLTITTAVFPIYYETITKNAGQGDLVDFFFWKLPNTVLYSYSLSFSFLFVAFILPLLTGIADYSGKKKMFMKMFAYLGSLACCGMYFFTSAKNVEWGITCSVLASIGYSGSLVFYNSFLPEIVSEDKFDKVSAQGFSYGYVGSVILLIINLLMIQAPELFALPEGSLPARISFIMVGIWWIGFSQYTFHYLPENVYDREPQDNIFTKGYKEIKSVFKSLKNLPNLRKFLVSFFFYSVGVQTVMYLAPLFGSKELQLETSKLILTVLIIQLVAVGGSFLFAKISELRGNKFSLGLMIILWIGVCIMAYFIQGEMGFYILGFLVGMVMGGIQALSRATYSKLIPVKTIDHASYFSFYDVTYNVSIVIGTFAYGLIEHITGSMRNSAIALAVFFIIGFAMLLLVSVPKRNLSEKEI